MADQIIDKRTVAIPGPIGDVTPAAQAIRDEVVPLAAQVSADALDVAQVAGGLRELLPMRVASTASPESPQALSMRLSSMERHFFDLALPLKTYRFDTDPTAANASRNMTWTQNGVNGIVDVPRSWNGPRGWVFNAPATANQVGEGGQLAFPAEAFCTIRCHMASFTSATGGSAHAGIELRLADGSKRVTFTYNESGSKPHYLNLSAGDNAMTNTTSVVTIDLPDYLHDGCELILQILGNSAAGWVVGPAGTWYAGTINLGVDLRAASSPTLWAGFGAYLRNGATAAVDQYSMDLSGCGQADPRVICYEDGTPIQAGSSIWLTMTTRGTLIPNAYQGVYRLDTATGRLEMTGAVFFDRGDGMLRNDNAGQILYDRPARVWRMIVIGHSDQGSATRRNWTGDFAADPRQGVSTLPVSAVGLPDSDLYEDMQAVKDGDHWLAVASHNASETVLMTASSLKGPWTRIAGAGSGETGPLIIPMGGSLWVLAGTSGTGFVIRSASSLSQIGKLALDQDTGGYRVWPVVFPAADAGGSTRWRMLSFDRSLVTGADAYSYGALYQYAQR
ncbi:MAG: hypothetical protein LKI60_04375 [Bifidobacterium tibiigranuli]|jgi:hypothetical protein|nr:hypothetical protein [Bifidobacterium tibiigranuli]MCI1797465.1 hypothetical protein [Bifidobacterium tibiigranuli]